MVIQGLFWNKFISSVVVEIPAKVAEIVEEAEEICGL